ncbi:Uma2 family endonuclease [Geminocystis sp. GBBB08]|uniref:Uma2 family endonuclease n=1 Tax=Geminocystis sp. GBBB08 TaxID=2604140 RepID=UPI0027E2DDB8|nr:Uma2 family endonuclease [Geminocystis sp. GBBB08]MBL1208185.1 Uma2 family endonuclease [Geminocystis sp. GBBB08]
MTITAIKNTVLTLEEFLQQDYIEESPAYEYIDNDIIKKPMPKIHHSRIQIKLASLIESIVETEKIVVVFTELRCNFGSRSIVPDIVVVSLDKIPLNEDNELENNSIFFPPDWTIEILSPNQKQTKVIDNILYCLEYGTSLGWLIDTDEKIIMVFEPEKPLKIYRDQEILPILKNTNLQLTPHKIFSWLKLK